MTLGTEVFTIAAACYVSFHTEIKQTTGTMHAQTCFLPEHGNQVHIVTFPPLLHAPLQHKKSSSAQGYNLCQPGIASLLNGDEQFPALAHSSSTIQFYKKSGPEADPAVPPYLIR